jgi:hypothetical protein
MIETAEYPTEPLRGAAVDSLGWLTGHWYGRRGDDQVEESWGALLGGTMMGMFRWVRDGTPYFYELTVLEPVEDTVLFRIKHFHPGLVGWEEKDRCITFALVAIGSDEAVFHQQGVAEPPWMVYRRSVDGTLASYFQLPGKPVPDDAVFRYRPVGGSSAR